MSPHHPRAPLRVVAAPTPMTREETARLLGFPALKTADGDPYHDRATNLSTSIRMLNDNKAWHEAIRAESLGWLGAYHSSARDQRLFRRFCLRGPLSMLLVQLRGEA